VGQPQQLTVRRTGKRLQHHAGIPKSARRNPKGLPQAGIKIPKWDSDFGFEASFGLRVSAFGFFDPPSSPLPNRRRLRYHPGMKKFFGLVLAFLLVGLASVSAQSPEDQYIQIYNLIREADTLNNNGQANQALTKYLEARTALQRFQKGYATWNSQVVKFRLSYLDDKISALSGQAPAPGAPAEAVARPAVTTSAAASSPAPPAKATVPKELEAQLAQYQEQVRQLQADKSLLEAKLKEALAAQPAPMDPRELAKSEERIKALQKENDLLKVSLNQAKAKSSSANVPAAPVPSSAQVTAEKRLSETNRKLAEQTSKAQTLESEKKALQKKLDSLIPSQWNAASIESTKKGLEDANRQLAEQKQLASKLTLEKEALENRLRSSNTDAEAAKAMRAENQVLKKQLADLKASHSVSAKIPDSTNQLAQARARIAVLESDKEMLRLEKIALENRMKQLSAGPAVSANAAPPPSKPDENLKPVASTAATDAAHIKQLERERDELQKKLASALKQSSSRKTKSAPPKVTELENQLSTLRARLEVFEARTVPYTDEELALLRNPEPHLAQTDPKEGKLSVKQLPPGTIALVADAQRYFADRRLDKAEEKYLQVLHKDDKNVPTLANLATIQLELGRLDEAEKHINQAVALAPNDAYSLSILGYLRYKQKKYDEALDALSRAAKIEPENAEIQNYLGLTLSQKGLRGPAETALRKAIQIDPSYGSAHNNLAVIYLSQQPPAVELARWHYQKALSSGHPRNPEFEKMFDARKSAEQKQ
jgi:tetratricopeptide (TPR) repeat protein